MEIFKLIKYWKEKPEINSNLKFLLNIIQTQQWNSVISIFEVKVIERNEMLNWILNNFYKTIL